MTDVAHARHGMDVQSFLVGFAHHLKYSLSKDRFSATDHDRFLALAYAVRDRLVERWIETQQSYHRENVKRVYYLSMEFLLGRSLLNNLVNLGVDAACREAFERLGYDWDKMLDIEVDAGLGNGGLGRLAACFLDSLATLGYPGMGYGLRYDYGIFRQIIHDGAQVEEPDNWLRYGNPWEFARPEYMIPVHFGGRVEQVEEGDPPSYRWIDFSTVYGMPYDTPICGCESSNVNTLRLWSAKAAEEFDLEDFSQGDYGRAVESKVMAENLTKVLYPDDRTYAGRELRLRQQYFFVSCTLQDVLRRHKSDRNPVDRLPEKAAMQLNDTHPALAIPELMRLLVDCEGLPWDRAWEVTVACMGYTNHTLLPEALEHWPVEMLERVCPRTLQVIYDVNQRFLPEVGRRWPGDAERVRRMSLITVGQSRQVRMAHLATIGSHSVNGVSEIHTELVKKRLLPDFREMFPERFNNKTNGVTPRRWIRVCNPGLAALVTERIGEGWLKDLDLLGGFEAAADEPETRERFLAVKRASKESLAAYIADQFNTRVDPASMFDVQVKRMHEYKRQLLNLLHIVHLFRRLNENPALDIVPRTFLFGGKAAPAYHMAKLIIRLIHAVAAAIDEDPAVRGRLKVVFVPDYRVSLAMRIVPAADLSEQISTAGMEASGTGNMKFAMNGALTIGTLDGANIEIMQEVGAENIFIFGLKADEVAAIRATDRNAGWEAYEKDPEIRALVDFLFSGRFDGNEPGRFEPIRQSILLRPDRYLHLADLRSYADAHQRVDALFRDRHAWARKAILNIARMGRFSSDRTIREYAAEIWRLNPAPVSLAKKKSDTTIEARNPRD